MNKFQDFSINALAEGGNPLAETDGKVVLAVNVASKCGLTPQYQGLEKLHGELGGQGFAVVGFPCNQFGAQEPGTPDEILEFCRTAYSVTFPLTEKIDVNGDDRHAIYRWLTDAFPGDIEWNFEKFLIDRDGKVIARFRSKVQPTSTELIEAIEAALGSAG